MLYSYLFLLLFFLGPVMVGHQSRDALKETFRKRGGRESAYQLPEKDPQFAQKNSLGREKGESLQAFNAFFSNDTEKLKKISYLKAIPFLKKAVTFEKQATARKNLGDDYQLEQNEIRYTAVLREVTIVGLIALAIICGLIYRNYYLKKRGNTLLTTKQDEINQQNELLKRLLDEKEWLIKEIHHRVKNNLQIVISLLNTQSAYLDNEYALFAIRKSQQRMTAISIIHQKLYQSEHLAAIDMSVYIHELVNYLREGFIQETQLTFTLDIAPLSIDVAQALPLGLILNEAISNAIKYAFTAEKNGVICITFRDREDGHYELIIADNGKGLAEDFDPEESNSLGMSLMHGLSQQLEGSLKFSNQNGLHISIVFTPKCINLGSLIG